MHEAVYRVINQGNHKGCPYDVMVGCGGMPQRDVQENSSYMPIRFTSVAKDVSRNV